MTSGTSHNTIDRITCSLGVKVHKNQATILGTKFTVATNFDTIALYGYGEMPSIDFSTVLVWVMTFTMTVHLSLRSFYSSLEDATTLKQVPFCSFYDGLLNEILCAKFWRGQRFGKF